MSLFFKESNLDELNGLHLKSSEYYIQTEICKSLAEYESNKLFYLQDDPNTYYIDYYLTNRELKDKNLFNSKNVREMTFVISKIDEKNKFSTSYYNCTGIVAIGKSKKNGKNISFLTHQDPFYFLSQRQNSSENKKTKTQIFQEELKNAFRNLKKLSEKGTIDIIILGGNNNEEFKEYPESIKLLDKVIYNEVKIHPTIVGGPTLNRNVTETYKNIYIDTGNRRVHLFKDYNKLSPNIHYTAKNIEKIINHLKTEN